SCRIEGVHFVLTFIEFIKAASLKTIAFTPEEVRTIQEQVGDAILCMGNVERDGCLVVPISRLVEAAQELADFQDDSDILFEMANLTQKDTGLPFVVWISP